MTMMINDSALEERLIEERRRTGVDRFDEVWERVYMMSPLADNEHQELAAAITHVCYCVVDQVGRGTTFPGVNVCDRRQDWQHNYRCPDVAVYLDGTTAENCGAFWCGGPDFGVEIVSPNDRAREKLDFYAKVNTRELLIVDREPWCLELYRLVDRRLSSSGRSTAENESVLASRVLPLTWRLVPGDRRSVIQVTRTDGGQHWSI